ncbi:uncharacterized protein LOC114572514 [Perca flavescens]|uniref:uncharacterized protein LOC114572514 n=1 Tax=Perca flavescens TaxID=8167 RepID=UPI00106E1396|nr:uncharacterized protein LOC114572514 [Perca flavescens]
MEDFYEDYFEDDYEEEPPWNTTPAGFNGPQQRAPDYRRANSYRANNNWQGNGGWRGRNGRRIIVIIAAADPTTITAEPAGKVARDPVAGPGREASSSHANSSHANGATTTTIKAHQANCRSIKPADPTTETDALIRENAEIWQESTLLILQRHYVESIKVNLRSLVQLQLDDWQTNFDIAAAWAKSHFRRRLSQDTLDTVYAKILETLPARPEPATRPATRLRTLNIPGIQNEVANLRGERGRAAQPTRTRLQQNWNEVIVEDPEETPAPQQLPQRAPRVFNHVGRPAQTSGPVTVTADVHRDAGNQGHRRETAGPEEQGELGGPPPRPLAQSSPAPPPTTTSPHASEDSTFSFVPPTPPPHQPAAAQAEPQPDLDTDGLTEADVLGNMRARLEVLRSTTGEVVATEIPDPGPEALDPLSITISDVETPRRATVQPSRGQIITEAAQTSLLDRGLTFVPSIQRQTNKEVRDILRADLQSYHRHLKLAVYYQDRRDSIQLPFLPKSNWSPALAHLPSEVSHLIQLDMTALQNDYRVGWTKSNLSRYELEALDQLSSNNNLVIKPADKGSAVVILDREDYLQEGFRQLNNTYYYKKLDGPIFKQTIPMVDKIVNTLHAKKFINTKQKNFLLSDKEPRAQDFTSSQKSIKQALKIPASAFLFSMDVEALYTNISTPDGLAAVKETFQNIQMLKGPIKSSFSCSSSA